MTRQSDTAGARTAIVFGALGGIGAAVVDALTATDCSVTRTSRTASPDAVAFDPFDADPSYASLPRADVVVWAQGANRNDSIDQLDLAGFEATIRANTTFVVASLQGLLDRGLIADNARLCVISSIWELIARPGKLSYTVSKAALGGLVRAAALDLAPRGVLINGVLPGVVDTEMTRSVLSSEQVAAFENATGFGRLVTLGDVANTVAFLCSPLNSGITGQSILVDLGFTIGRSL